MELTIAIAAIIGGFVVLLWGADRFVYGAAATARNLGVSTLVIGLTIVAFGTSAPEILVSIMAAINGNPGIAVGNGIGSNIANIGLVLGVTALVLPLMVHSQLLKREFPILLGLMFFGAFLILDNELGRLDGILLLSALFILTGWLIYKGMNQPKLDEVAIDYEIEIARISTTKALLWTLVGLILLLVSSRILIYGAVSIAKMLGISDLIIGLTIIAIGTSLPELATSIVSALKKETDIAIGNILGSNMFNLLAVLGIPAVISPIMLDSYVLYRDYLSMLILSIMLFIFAYGFRGRGCISRVEGGLLLTGYISYMVVIYFNIQQG